MDFSRHVITNIKTQLSFLPYVCFSSIRHCATNLNFTPTYGPREASPRCTSFRYDGPVRNEVAKVMFLQASVCPQGVGGGGVCPRSRHPPSRHPLGADSPWNRHPPGADTPPEQTPPPRYGHCCGRYASYWNAFLSIILIHQKDYVCSIS